MGGEGFGIKPTFRVRERQRHRETERDRDREGDHSGVTRVIFGQHVTANHGKAGTSPCRKGAPTRPSVLATARHPPSPVSLPFSLSLSLPPPLSPSPSLSLSLSLSLCFTLPHPPSPSPATYLFPPPSFPPSTTHLAGWRRAAGQCRNARRVVAAAWAAKPPC
jgi:hypothetical protein